MQILAHTFFNIFVLARNRKLLNVSLQVVIYIMFFAFDGNDDKYQTIIHRISMRCRLFMMLANVARNPFCHNIEKNPLIQCTYISKSVYIHMPVHSETLSTDFENRLITFEPSSICLIQNSIYINKASFKASNTRLCCKENKH